MTLQIEISDDALRELEGKAAREGISAAELASRIVRSQMTPRDTSTTELTPEPPPHWLDVEAMADAKAEADPSITLQTVRHELSSIEGSMSDIIRSERDRD